MLSLFSNTSYAADALLVATDAFFFTRAPQLVVLAARHAIPTVYFRRESRRSRRAHELCSGLHHHIAESDVRYTQSSCSHDARILQSRCSESPLPWDQRQPASRLRQRFTARPRVARAAHQVLISVFVPALTSVDSFSQKTISGPIG